MKITRNHQITVTAPPEFSEQEVVSFVQKNINRFAKDIARLQQKALFSLPHQTMLLNGVKKSFTVLTGFPRSTYKVIGQKIYFYTKIGTDDQILSALKKALHDETAKYINRRQPFFERKMDIPSHKIKYSYRESNWGFNNVQNHVISYSTKLAHFPDHVKDYLIVHELAHFHFPNHSPAFWDLVKKYLPNYQTSKKQLV